MTLKLSKYVSLVLVLALAIALGCGGVKTPQDVFKKMVKAYGGSAKIELMQAYSGNGFIKAMESPTAVSNAFDIYIDGPFYKHRIALAPEGTLIDENILYHNMTGTWQWTKHTGLKQVPALDLAFWRYRFPAVLKWIETPGLKGDVRPFTKVDTEYRVRMSAGDTTVTLDVDRVKWLLNGVEITLKNDSSFFYEERYERYWKVDNIPFPSTWVATLNGKPYFEYTLSRIDLGAPPDSVFGIVGQDTSDIQTEAPPAAEGEGGQAPK
jgi:hypothetical protein